ncbi:hypothetical protein D3C81_31650 [compost metagenome]
MELVNDGGWRGARLPEIRGEMYARLSGLLGPISGKGDAVIGQVIAVSSEEDLQIVEGMGWLYAGYFISQGEGTQLDGVGEWLNLPRRGLTESAACVVYLLKPDSSVNPGDSFQVSGIDGDWLVAEGATAKQNLCTGLVLAVKDTALVSGNTFVLSVNGVDYSTQFEAGDTSDSVLARLYGLVMAGNASLTTMTTAYGMMLYAADGQSVVAFSFTEDVFDVVRVGMSVTAYFDSDTYFPVVSYGDVVSDDVLVLTTGTQGYRIENDELYRARLQAEAASRKKASSASRPGIRDAILAVDGVSYCAVNTNRGIQTDSDGLPGKSVQAFVAGGSDDAVAQALWEACAGECGTFGTSHGTATQGDVSETMYFTRQAFQSVFASVSGAVWDPEGGGQPDDYYATARTIISDYFTALVPGRDVYGKQIESRLIVSFAPLLTDITVNVGVAANPTGRVVSVADGVIAVTTGSQIVIEGEA